MPINLKILSKTFILLLICLTSSNQLYAQKPKFKVIAFYTGINDQAHVSYVHEANAWFPKMAEKYDFSYDSTSNWSNLNAAFLAKYQVVLFLDTRPEKPEQRAAFETYMKNGGAWMGFHFSAFALTPSAFPQNWDWYHNEFLGSGQYGSNTWRPTSAVLRTNRNHPVTKNLPDTFKSQPNEWYRWEKDLRKNPNIDILLAIDSTSFPLGTGPKAYEIWQSGYYPVVWSNKNYKMMYVNMGHNDMDYEHKFGKTTTSLSHTFENETQNKMIINGLLWLGNSKKSLGKESGPKSKAVSVSGK
ncbi:ThuA domain-containing protein [Pedobacter sp. LMG 31464]|uniref:ThuA domain-containing protein n=1 Tax=Pedobacter planticolens TaxID=2679964 RepID=A0A923IVT2_9SPHI|nr:ThuA domain-containing protein [Pedobacter planticolens]MBB2145484.1 ThuA domain-containing protein [Pedobacter planticolens]